MTDYLHDGATLKSWLLTKDHKRIALLYLFSILFFFTVGGFAAMLMRIELTSPHGLMMTNETYNRLFTVHGVVMVWFFLIPSIPAILGNFILPLMIGAKDLAFPKLNLASWYIYILSGVIVMAALIRAGRFIRLIAHSIAAPSLHSPIPACSLTVSHRFSPVSISSRPFTECGRQA